MRRTLIVVAVVAGILLAAVVGGMFYVKSTAEARFDSALERLSSPSMVLKKVRYEGTLFGAEAESSLEFSAGPQKFAIPFKHSIAYAPFASGLAEVHTEMTVPPAFKPVVDAVFHGAVPLKGDTVIHLDGSEETRFESPAFTTKVPDGTVQWQGIQGTLSLEGEHVVFDAAAPGLKMQGSMGTFSLQGISAKGDMTKATDAMWFGSSTVEMKKLEANPAQLPPVAVDGLKLSAGLTEQGSGLVRYNVAFDVKKISAQDLTFSGIGYEMELGNLDRVILAKWSKAAENYRPKGADVGAELAGMMVNDMAAFLKRSPKLTLKRCAAVTPWGDFKANGSATFDGKGELPAQPMEWISRITVEGKLDISAGLLDWVLQQQVRERAVLIANAGRKPQPETAPLLTGKLAQLHRLRLEQKGAIIRNGDRYTLEVKSANGAATVNGKSLDEVGALLD